MHSFTVVTQNTTYGCETRATRGIISEVLPFTFFIPPPWGAFYLERLGNGAPLPTKKLSLCIIYDLRANEPYLKCLQTYLKSVQCSPST